MTRDEIEARIAQLHDEIDADYEELKALRRKLHELKLNEGTGQEPKLLLG